MLHKLNLDDNFTIVALLHWKTGILLTYSVSITETSPYISDSVSGKFYCECCVACIQDALYKSNYTAPRAHHSHALLYYTDYFPQMKLTSNHHFYSILYLYKFGSRVSNCMGELLRHDAHIRYFALLSSHTKFTHVLLWIISF